AEMCFLLQEHITLKTAAVVEPFACMMQGILQVGGVSASDVVHIHGLGALGLAAVIQAVTAGALVVAFDPSPKRRELATKLGAKRVYNPLDKDSSRAMLTEEFGSDLADLVVEASGVPSVQAQAIESGAQNGRVLLMGVST